MRVSSHTHTTNTTTLDIDGEPVELELSQTPSCIMNYRDEVLTVSPSGRFAVLGYLVDDSDCQNPLEDFEGQGAIYTASRRGSKESIRNYYKAMGLDAYGDPAYDEDEVFNRYEAYFVANMPIADCPARIDEREPDESDETYLKRCAQVDFDHDQSKVVFPDALDKIHQTLMQEARNPLAVLLDVYEHSGIAYSVSGEGMQDRWDTAKAGAVWVPDAIAEENIAYKAIQSLLPTGTSVAYISTPEKLNAITYTLQDGTQKAGFSSFTEAIRAAAGALGVQIDESKVMTCMKDEARSYAKSVAEEYTRWCNGENYGYVVDQYEKDDSGNWELVNDESCYGFIGGEYAEEQMIETAKYCAEQNQEKEAAAPAPATS